jgi:HEAT repeat protein
VALGAARKNHSIVFLPLPEPSIAAVSQQVPAADSTRVRQLLDAARGANALMCDLATGAVDGRFGWSSDDNFTAGGADSVSRAVTRWVHEHDIDATALPTLRAGLADADACVRRLAAPLLGRIKAPAAYQAMTSALGASDASVREMGALALGYADDPRAVSPLAERLKDDAPRVRAMAAWALGEIERPESVRPLIDALKDQDSMVRRSAAHALGEVEDATAIPALTDVLRGDRDPEVRRAAALALGEIMG